ncbi:MAG: efflux transporter periplasmic adaptor subunit [Actinomycetia bacterium]|nr:efflux transporter periplasmic adaptor subunit [Actinomycetes bacterium]
MLTSEIETVTRGAPPRRRRRRTRVLIAGTAMLAVSAAGAAIALQSGGSGTEHPTGSTLPTADVVRTDLAARTEVDGTLGYAHTYTVLAGGAGRLTWLPTVGTVIRRGQRMYGVDGHRVPLVYGAIPLWRALQSGMSNGRDVLELERNLVALGYGSSLTVDRHFTYATMQAIKDWQDDLGVTKSGSVQPGDVVVQPGAIRVTSLKAVLGGQAAGNVLTATSTERQVTVNVPVSQQEIAKQGAEVHISLPGGKTTTGHIFSVGTVATAGSTDSRSQTGQGTETATIPVSITLDKPGAAGRFDGAPVTVGFTSTLHKSVLAVPVNALLAAPGGGYAVDVVESTGRVRSVPVRLGIFADDNLEVSGDLTAGMKVQVPRS